MKLLILTQAVDSEDPVLGFFHRWIEEFARRCEQVTVVCLREGQHALPSNVRVFSLGKEGGPVSRLRYALRFWHIVRRERQTYNAVFVHMNQEYVLLGGILWRLWGKKIFLWRNHREGTWLTDVAVALSSRVFCTSKGSYTFRFRKTMMMPVGIDTDYFSPADAAEKKEDILSLGRLSPVKRVHILIDACRELSRRGMHYATAIVGEAASRDDNAYVKRLRDKAEDVSGEVSFHTSIVHDQTRNWYHNARVFVNLTPTGSFDKTILEAASCGCVVLASAEDYVQDAGEMCRASDNPITLAGKIQTVLSQPKEAFEKMRVQARELVVRKHGLNALMSQLMKEMENR